MRTPMIVATAAVLSLAGCAAPTPEADDASSKDHTVLYEVTAGKANNASITYTDGNTQTTQDTDAKLPWKKEIETTGSTVTFQVIAQNATGKGGKISCKITVDGKVEAENTSKGVGAIATCNT